MPYLTVETLSEYNARLTALYVNVTDDGVYVDDTDEVEVEPLETEFDYN